MHSADAEFVVCTEHSELLFTVHKKRSLISNCNTAVSLNYSPRGKSGQNKSE